MCTIVTFEYSIHKRLQMMSKILIAALQFCLDLEVNLRATSLHLVGLTVIIVLYPVACRTYFSDEAQQYFLYLYIVLTAYHPLLSNQ